MDCSSLISTFPCPHCAANAKLDEKEKHGLEAENVRLARELRETKEKLANAVRVVNGDGPKSTPAPPQINLTGEKAESTEDEYRKIYDNELPLNFVLPSLVSVQQMTNDQILDRIHEMQELSKIVKIKWQMSYITLNQKLEGETEEERERVRRKDASFKPRIVSEGQKEKVVKARAASKSKEEKAMEALIPMFLSQAGGDKDKAKVLVVQYLKNNMG